MLIIKTNSIKRSVSSATLAALCFFIFACNKPDEVEIKVFDANRLHSDNPVISKQIEVFQADTSIKCKISQNIILSAGAIDCLVLSGLKDSHPWFQLLNLDDATTYTEWTSPTTMSQTVSVYLGYGETATYTLTEVFPRDYIETENGAIVTWYAWSKYSTNEGDRIYQLYFREFKYNNAFQTHDKIEGHPYPVLLVGDHAYCDNKCFSLSGETLFDVSYQLYHYISGYELEERTNYDFASNAEDVVVVNLSNTNSGNTLIVDRVSLRTGETVWSWSSELGERYSELRINYGISYESSDVWVFTCVVTLYDGTTITKTAKINVETGTLISYSEF